MNKQTKKSEKRAETRLEIINEIIKKFKTLSDSKKSKVLEYIDSLKKEGKSWKN